MPEAPPPGGSGDIGPYDLLGTFVPLVGAAVPSRAAGAYSSSSLRTAIKASVGI